MRTKLTILWVAWLIAGVVMVIAVSGTSMAPPSLAGTYRLEGTNPDGKVYTGFVFIEASGRVWRLRWQMADAEAVGYGLLRDHVFAVVFSSDGAIGVASYTVTGGQGKHRLTGQWFYPPTDLVGTETLIETKDIPPPASVPAPRVPAHPQVGV